MMSVMERFISKVVFTESCWLWDAGLNDRGYGTFTVKGKTLRAHRWSYETFVAPIPSGLEIDHLCRVRRCVRPDHLEAVTHRVNTLRGNTITASAARKTHCPQGHSYNAQNTKLSADGRRYCRACHRNYNREYNKTYRRKKGKKIRPADMAVAA